MQALVERGHGPGIHDGGGAPHGTGKGQAAAAQPARRNRSKRNKFKQTALQEPDGTAGTGWAAAHASAGVAEPAAGVVARRPLTEGAGQQAGCREQAGRHSRQTPESVAAAEPAERVSEAAHASPSQHEPDGSRARQQHAAQDGRAEAEGRKGAQGKDMDRGLQISKQSAAAAVAEQGARPEAGGGLLARMRARLSGGQFRWLNEKLYTCPGAEALAFMQAQPELFRQYHEVTHLQPQIPSHIGNKTLGSREAMASPGAGELRPGQDLTSDSFAAFLPDRRCKGLCSVLACAHLTGDTLPATVLTGSCSLVVHARMDVLAYVT